jgi:hypothetical protein
MRRLQSRHQERMLLLTLLLKAASALLTLPDAKNFSVNASLAPADQQHNIQMLESMLNLTKSVDSLSAKFDKLSLALNDTMGAAVQHSLADLTTVLNEVMGKKLLQAVGDMENTMDRTMLSAQKISDQVENTARTAAQNLNDSVR